MIHIARHLQQRRPRQDRAVTWSRSKAYAGVVRYTFWRRDLRNALHLLDVAFTLTQLKHSRPGVIQAQLREAHRELRDFVDEIDLLAMEKKA